ncbi:MAG TPA: type II toxin-antitoxin system RelB/DinJ family antitoxin [Kiritimatiellia bacterium]|nr:type II toxin-antitoxin system RelB/DinJ family antitoxin [Kiritimatiellia bacterium]
MKAARHQTVLVRARVPARRLKKAEKILGRLGLKTGDAINMLMAQVELRQGLPFDLSVAESPLITPDMQGAEWSESLGEY